MSEIKLFPTRVIASLSSGVLLCEFGKMHEAAEWLMGHPIWTHHFADKTLWREMQAAILEQAPGFPTDLEGVNKENYLERADDLDAQLGDVVAIRKGSGLTARLPTDGIPDHVQVIQVRP